MIWVIKKMGGDRPNSQPDDVSISFAPLQRNPIGSALNGNSDPKNQGAHWTRRARHVGYLPISKLRPHLVARRELSGGDRSMPFWPGNWSQDITRSVSSEKAQTPLPAVT